MLVTNELAVSLRVIICFEEPIRFLKVVLIHIQKSFLGLAPQVIPSFLHRQLHCWKWHFCKTAVCICYKGQEPMQQISVSPHRKCKGKGECKLIVQWNTSLNHTETINIFMSHTFLTIPLLCMKIAVKAPPVSNYTGQQKIWSHKEKCLFLMYFWTLNSNMFPEFLYHPYLLRCIWLCENTSLHMWVAGGL